MVVFYLDTSVVVKRYMEEPGSEFADRLYDNVIASKDHSLSTSILTIVEFIATISGAKKGEIITEEDLRDIVHIFTKETEHIKIRPLDESIMVKSIGVIIDHSVRTMDALHLSSAMQLRDMMEGLNEKGILVSNDTEMCDAALNDGFIVLRPDERGLRELNEMIDDKRD